jgi:uncharacterized protein YabN with tetrapyrrole methylase and pyrophosphatase domain
LVNTATNSSFALARHQRVATQMEQVTRQNRTDDQLLKAVTDELAEFNTLLSNPHQDPPSLLKYQLEDEWGDTLYSLLNVARRFHIDPAKALGRTLSKIELRLQVAKELSANLPPEQINGQALWQQAKNLIRSRYPQPASITSHIDNRSAQKAT